MTTPTTLPPTTRRPSAPSARPTTAPVLLMPVGGAAVDAGAATFAWRAAAGTGYQLQVAADAAFERLVLDTPVGPAPEVTVFDVLPSDGATYHWRVRTDGAAPTWSAPAAFRAVTDVEAAREAANEAAARARPVPRSAHAVGAAPGTAIRPPHLDGTTTHAEALRFVLLVVIGLASMIWMMTL